MGEGNKTPGDHGVVGDIHYGQPSRMTEAEVWGAADAMRDLYGENASLHAAVRADRLLDGGDPDGFHDWIKVSEAIQNLERIKPSPGEFSH